MSADAFGDFDHVRIEHHCSMGAANPFKGQGIARDPLPAAILIAFDAGRCAGFGCRTQQQNINPVNFRRDVMDGVQPFATPVRVVLGHDEREPKITGAVAQRAAHAMP